MNLHDSWQLEHVSQEQRIWTLALYAKHLATGSTLVHRRIKSSTIESYLRDIAKWLSKFCHTDSRKSTDLDQKMAPPICAVIDEVKRLEKMPDQREPFTWEMWDHLVAIPDSPEGLMTALKVWFASGLYGGFRLSEWAQHDQHANIAEPALDAHGIPLAFCLEDLDFRGIGNKRITLAEAYTMREEDIARTWVNLSHQKNGDHGEKRMFTWNKGSPDKCCCRQLHRAFKRFIRLCGWAYGKPLSVYKDAHGIVRNITAQNISSVMRRVASELYGLDPVRHKTELQKWSSHSLRVGACVILHTMGFTGEKIQFLLRWRSRAFMMYLRNLAALSHSQNMAMTAINEVPNTI